MSSYNLIQGSNFVDARGGLNFFNTFDMNQIVRMYEISSSDTEIIRGWQGHEKEKKWFYCNSGSFTVNLILLDTFTNPSRNIVPERIQLSADKPLVLEISGGFATGFKATETNSKLLVFSDFSLEASKADDFRFPVDYWSGEW